MSEPTKPPVPRRERIAWRPPTRRAFVGMLAAAAAALAIRTQRDDDPPLWIGHF